MSKNYKIKGVLELQKFGVGTLSYSTKIRVEVSDINLNIIFLKVIPHIIPANFSILEPKNLRVSTIKGTIF